MRVFFSQGAWWLEEESGKELALFYFDEFPDLTVEQAGDEIFNILIARKIRFNRSFGNFFVYIDHPDPNFRELCLAVANTPFEAYKESQIFLDQLIECFSEFLMTWRD